jgi:hypothetical protein
MHGTPVYFWKNGGVVAEKTVMVYSLTFARYASTSESLHLTFRYPTLIRAGNLPSLTYRQIEERIRLTIVLTSESRSNRCAFSLGWSVPETSFTDINSIRRTQ